VSADAKLSDFSLGKHLYLPGLLSLAVQLFLPAIAVVFQFAGEHIPLTGNFDGHPATLANCTDPGQSVAVVSDLLVPLTSSIKTNRY